MLTDPLTGPSGPTTMWATGNVSEALPGVPTPLSWTLQARAINVGTHRSFVDMGAVAARSGGPVDPDHSAIAIFCGRPVGNVSCFLRAVACLPGTTVAAAVALMFGSDAEPPAGIADTRRRYAAVFTRLPVTTVLTPRRLRRLDQRVRAFRARHLPATGSAGDARRVLAEAADLLVDCLRLQGFVTFLGHGLYERIAALSRAAGRPGLESQLVSGYGGVEETALARDLWAVAAGVRPLDWFLIEHGHHGPREGELSATSWREDPEPLRRTIDTIGQLPSEDHPDEKLRRQARQRQRLEHELINALPTARRIEARLVLRMAAGYLPLRERTRSLSHRVFDTARAHARHLGATLAAAGALPDGVAVFDLTLDEVLQPEPPTAVDALVTQRRQRRAHYEALRVPPVFIGPPTVSPAATGGNGAGALRGVAVSPGIVEGPARVVTDPSQETRPIEPGEILVCHVTDPSWMTLMIGAAALVTDVGSVISHAAIAARELGIPCVVGTERATAVVRSGDHLRVDGGTGTVVLPHESEVVSHGPTSP